MIRLFATAAFTASILLGPAAHAATAEQKKETCEFGANDKKLSGAARKSFMAKCMSNKDSPRGKPMPASKQQQ